jgi:transposase-like protein
MSEAMKRTRRNHGATFKAQVALAAVKGDKTLAELAEQFRINPTQINEWKQQSPARAADVFVGNPPTTRRTSRSSTRRSEHWRWRMRSVEK